MSLRKLAIVSATGVLAAMCVSPAAALSATSSLSSETSLSSGSTDVKLSGWQPSMGFGSSAESRNAKQNRIKNLKSDGWSEKEAEAIVYGSVSEEAAERCPLTSEEEFAETGIMRLPGAACATHPITFWDYLTTFFNYILTQLGLKTIQK